MHYAPGQLAVLRDLEGPFRVLNGRHCVVLQYGAFYGIDSRGRGTDLDGYAVIIHGRPGVVAVAAECLGPKSAWAANKVSALFHHVRGMKP